MIRAIIFDCYGVLVEESWNVFKHNHFGDDDEKFKEAERLMNISNAGNISYDQFVTMVAELAEISREELELELKQNAPNLRLFELIKTLKKDYKIGFLSNVASNFLDQLFTPEQLSYFDEFALSCDLGLIKPDPKIYKKTAEMLQCDLEQCVFIDDNVYYIEGAESVGMKVVHYKDFDQASAELKQILAADTDK